MSWKEPPKGIDEIRRTLDLQRRQRLNHHDEQGLTAADKAPWNGLTPKQIHGLQVLVRDYLDALFPYSSAIDFSVAMFVWTKRETDIDPNVVGDFWAGGVTGEEALEMIKDWMEPNKDG